MLTLQKNNYLNSTFKSDNGLKKCLTLLFFILGFIGILNHEMWRDELQSWLIAKDSSSIVDLFNNLRYEGHPGLWHSCLYLITRFTHNPLAMQIFHLLLATSVIYIFIEFSPFNVFQKILFTFGYFPFYEYSLISRSYSLGILLIFTFCALYKTRDRSYFTLSVILALLANTHAYGLIIALALSITLILDGLLDRNIRKLFKTKKWDILVSLFIVFLGILMSIFQMLIPADADFEGEAIRIENFNSFNFFNNRVLTSFLIIWRSYIPISNFFKYHFWNTNILMNEYPIARICVILFTIGLLLYSASLFIRKPIVLFLYLSVTIGFVAFNATKLVGSLRHNGHLFIMLLACLWISSYYLKSDWIIDKLKFDRKTVGKLNLMERYKNVYLGSILFVHVIGGLYAFSMDLSYPFSSSKEIANYIVQQGLQNSLLIGSRDYAASPIAAFLDKKIHYVESNKLGSFVVWKNRKLLKPTALLNQVDRLIKPNHKALLILNYKLKDKNPDLNIVLMLQSSKSIVPDETYYLYEVEKKPVKS